MPWLQTLRNEIIDEDQDHTLHIESEKDRSDAKLIAGPQAIIILGGMDKCGDGFAIMCGKYYATIMHRSLEKSHQRIPSAQKDNIIRAQNQYTTNAGITEYDSNNTDNPQDDGPSRNPEPRAVSKAYILAKMHKKLPGVRIIAGGCGLSLTAVSQVVSRACKLILRAYDKIYHEMFIKVGFSRKSPIAISTDDINIRTDYFNTLIARNRYNITNGKVLSMDFTKLYPSLEVDSVLEKLQIMIAFAFHREETDFFSKPSNDNKALRKQKIYIKIEQYPSKAEAEWTIGPPPQGNLEENDNDIVVPVARCRHAIPTCSLRLY